MSEKVRSKSENIMRILLATDSDILRTRLRAVISEILNVENILEVTDENSVVDEVRSTGPDIILIAFQKFGRSTTGLLPGLGRVLPRAPRIVLTFPFSFTNEDLWREAGATHVFDLTIQFNQFIDCLLECLHSEKVDEHKVSDKDTSGSGSQCKEVK